MAWTYDPEIPTDKDWVRLTIGDTNESFPLMQDEEIEYYITETGSKESAAIACVEAIIPKLALLYNRKKNADSEIEYDAASRTKWYNDLLDKLLSKYSGCAPYAGGISKADIAANKADTDVLQPSFEVGQFDMPGTGQDGKS